MSVRRVVLGVDESGAHTVISDAKASRQSVFSTVPGFEVSLLWSIAADADVGRPSPFRDPTLTGGFLPGPGESRLLLVTFPPDAVMMREEFDGAAFAAEFQRLVPGLAETFEPDVPGMHTTDSVDYDIVLDGEIVLEMGDGKEVLLRRHDVAVQQGTRHAWRNKSDKPATLLFVLQGCRRAT